MSQTMDAFSLWRRAWLTSVTKTTTMTTSTAPTTTTTTMPTPTTLTTTMTSRTAKSRTTTTTTPTTTTLTATKMTARTGTSRTATTMATSTTTPTTFPWNDIFLFHHFLVLEQERVIIDQAKVDWKCFFCFNRKRAAKGGIAPDVKKSVTTGDRLLDLAPFDWACKHLLQL